MLIMAEIFIVVTVCINDAEFVLQEMCFHITPFNDVIFISLCHDCFYFTR
jgi:hypothetical protein